MPIGLAGLELNHRLSSLCGFDSHISDNIEVLSQYDPGW